MKTPIATTLALLLILTAAGCSGSGTAGTATSAPAPSPTAPASPTLPATLPGPDSDERKALLAELAKINPEFTGDRTVEDARRVCAGMLGGTPLDRLLVTVTDLFSSDRKTPVADDDEARRILQVIGSNGFCR